MNRYVPTILPLLLIAAAIGCSKFSVGSSPASLTRQLIDLLDDTAEILSTVHDEASARAVASDLQGLSQKRNELQNRLNQARMKGVSVEENRRLQEKYGERLKASMHRVVQETSRLQGIPGAWRVVSSHVRRITSGSRGMATGGYAGREAAIAGMYGAHRTLTLVVEDTPGDVAAAIAKRIKAICKPREMSYSSEANRFHLVCGPVDDMPGLVSKIDFGTVIETDYETGFVRVQADASRLPKPLAAAVTSPSDPRFYRQNLEDLRSVDDHRARAAAERLAKAEPGGPREEIVAAAEKLIREKHHGCKQAIAVVARYRGEEAIPLLIDVVRDEDYRFSREEAADFLIEFEDPRCYEALAELVVNDKALAHKMWRKVGATGQHALYPYLKHEEEKVRRDTIQIIRDICNGDTVPALVEILDDDSQRIRELAVETLGKTKDQRAISPLCKVLLTETARGNAVRALVELGPMVEATVIKGLDHSDPAVVKACCNVLQEVGGQKSLNALQKLKQSGNAQMRRDAEWAAMLIEKRISGDLPRRR